MTRYWFRKRKGLMSKDMGWGWMPISWEGWAVIAVFIAILLLSSLILIVFNGKPNSIDIIFFILIVAVSMTAAVLISWKKSKP